MLLKIEEIIALDLRDAYFKEINETLENVRLIHRTNSTGFVFFCKTVLLASRIRVCDSSV